MAAFDPATILAALRTTGNNQLADELERGQQPAPQPTPAPAPQQQAQPPVQQPPPVQETAPVEPPQIEDKAWNPRASAGQLSGDIAQGQQRALDLTSAVGAQGANGSVSGGDIRAEGLQRQADLYGELEGKRKERLDTATQRLEGNRSQKDALEREMFAKLDEISDREKNPPKDVMGMVMGILGAAMAAKGNQGGAVAAQMIGQAVGSKTQAWARELESDKAAVGRMQKMFDLQNDDTNNELDQEAKVSTLMAGQFDAALKKVGAETDSKEVKVAAEAARNKLRMDYAAHQLNVKQRQAAGAGNDALWKLSIQELSSLMAQGKLGKEGQAVLTEKMKREQAVRQGEANISKDEASAAAALASAEKERAQGGAAGVKPVAGLRPLEGASANDRNEAQKILAAQQQLDSSLAILERLQGSADANDKATYDIQRKLALGSMNSLANAGVLNPGELEDWNKKFPMHVYDNVGNSFGWNPIANVSNAVKSAVTDEEKVLRDMRGIFRGKADAALKTYNYERDTSTPQPQQSAPQPAPQQQPAPQASPSVTMYRRDGTPIQIRAELVDAAKARGYTTEPAAPNLTSGG